MRLYLIDGTAYLFRAFHALPALSTSKGEPSGVILGVANMLRKLLAEDTPDYLAVVFDTPGPTFRTELFPAYKENRPSISPTLVTQIQPLQELIQIMGLPVIKVPGVEADDVIATLATQASAQGWTTLIISSDKDFTQLVEERITIRDPLKNIRLDRNGVIAKFGVPPERMVDYLALVGDAIDNIPGMPGVGPKTAVQWLQNNDSLDQIVATRLKGRLDEQAAVAHLSLTRSLLTLRRDVILPMDLADLRPQPPDSNRLKEILRRWEFHSWLADLEPIPLPNKHEIVSTPEALNVWINRLASSTGFSFQCDTVSPSDPVSPITGISIALGIDAAAYILFISNDSLFPLDEKIILNQLKPFFENPTYAKLGHDLKYQTTILANHGIQIWGIQHDTLLEAYVLDSHAVRQDLNALVLKCLGERVPSYADHTKKDDKQIAFDQMANTREYAVSNSELIQRLHQHLWPRLESEPRLRALYETLEIPLIPVLTRMERHGVLIDTVLLRDQSLELSKQLLTLENECHHIAGCVFNLASPKQIQEILFERLKLPVLDRTPGGKASTAEDVLEKLAVDHELPRRLLAHRSLAKLRSTYTERLPTQVNPKTGRIHTTFHQAVTSTGRLSSSDPNLQNIPIRTPEGRRIRAAFIASPGYYLLSADYSQIELRIMAHLSGDSGLITAFREGRDIHRATAAEVLGISPEEVTEDQRRSAKAINFGLIYGMSAFGLARQLGIDRQTADKYMNVYFTRYPGVKRFMEETRALARTQGYVETVDGRRLYLPEINSKNRQRREAAERTAINAPLQGTAADIIKRAMIEVDAWLVSSHIEAKMILQVHDELVLEVAQSAVTFVTDQMIKIMAGVACLTVPLDIHVKTGLHW